VNTVAVAWDFGRAAARALSDAMPLLQLAKDVRLFTITNEKPIDLEEGEGRLTDYLKLHGITAALERVDANRRTAGETIAEYTKSNHIDMLVMGAFGHSRLMEFVLGGATRDVVNRPPVPVLLSY
jgi:nucleotide-binding universal stress UspA family protein